MVVSSDKLLLLLFVVTGGFNGLVGDFVFCLLFVAKSNPAVKSNHTQDVNPCVGVIHLRSTFCQSCFFPIQQNEEDKS